MKIKRTMAVVLSAALLCTGALAAAANTSASPAQDAPAASEPQNVLAIQSAKMKVVEFQQTSGVYPHILVQPVDEENAQQIQLNLSADTYYLDSKTGLAVNPDTDIKVGDEIYAYYSSAMTRSIPPQSAAYAIVVNLDEKAAPAHYLVAEAVTKNDDGSVTVLAESGTILVTIAKDTPITPYLTKNIVTNQEIEVGTRLFAWYDQVALSMPGQAHATKAVLLPAESSDPATADARADQPLNPGETAPYRFETTATITEVTTSTHEGDIKLVPSITVKTPEHDELVVNLGENTLVADAKAGTVVQMTDVANQTEAFKKGDEIVITYGPAMTASLPPQVSAEAVAIHMDNEHAAPHLLTAEHVTRNADGSVTALTDNGGLYVTVGKDTPAAPLRTKNIVTNQDIRMGTTFFAWYDVVMESYPGQTHATRVLLLPEEDRALTIISEGDIAIGEGKVENGVAMVPLRLVAEKLGFTVTWNGEAQSVKLSNGTREMTVVLGQDSYNFAAAQETGLVGMSSPVSLGAAPYEVDGTTWAPAELVNLLVDGSPANLFGDTLYL